MSYSDITMTGSVEEVTSHGSTPVWDHSTVIEKTAVSTTRTWYKWSLLLVYIVMVTGLILNSITLIAYLKSSVLQRGKPAQHLIFNIMVSDLLTTVALQPFLIFHYTDIGAKFIRGRKYTCIFSGSLMMMSFDATYFAILLLTLERLIAIVFPLLHMRKVTKKTCQVAIIVSWSIITIKAGVIFFLNTWSPGSVCLQLNFLPQYFAHYIHNPTLFGSLGLILLGNIVLGVHVLVSKKVRLNLKAGKSKCKKFKLLQEMKMTRMLFIVVLCLFLSWIPFNVAINVVLSQSRKGRVSNVALIFRDFSRGFLVAGAVADPLIYIWQNQQCMQAVKKLFGKKHVLKGDITNTLAVKAISK